MEFIGRWAEVKYSDETIMTHIILKDSGDYLTSYPDDDGYALIWYSEDEIGEYIYYVDNYIPTDPKHYRYIV